MFNRNGLSDEENDLKSISSVVDSRIFANEPQRMKHKELIELLNATLLEEDLKTITKVIKSSVSGMNYLSVKFDSQTDLDKVYLKLPKAHKCEKRYGFGLIVSEYTFK